MKKILKRITSRLVLTLLIMLLQIGWVVNTIYEVTEVNPIFNIVLRIIALGFALYVVFKHTKNHNKISWVFLILFLPIVGVPCYFLFGRTELTKGMRTRMHNSMEMLAPLRTHNEETEAHLEAEGGFAFRTAKLIESYGRFPVYREEDTRYFKSGESVFPCMLEDLKQAKEFIFIEFFIMEPGKMLDSIVEILEAKIKEGVHVRLIYDDFGCTDKLPPGYYKLLQAKGIHCASFNSFRPFLSIIMNNRDHRKIMVIDGKVAYTGGVNLADEYINEIERFGYWKDAAIRITGEAVWSFTTMFLEMWSYITKGSEDFTKFKTIINDETTLHQEGKGYVIPYADCPLEGGNIGEGVYLDMIAQAKKYVYIFTPYLIPSEEFVTALCHAAAGGVDVRIVTPAVPDKRTVFLVTQANYENLIRAGVKIYQYTPGFIHSKCFVADDEYAVVGSYNLDFRSLYLHFECAAFLYKTACIKTIKEDALETFELSHRISLEECENKNFFYQLFLSVLRLFAPLM